MKKHKELSPTDRAKAWLKEKGYSLITLSYLEAFLKRETSFSLPIAEFNPLDTESRRKLFELTIRTLEIITEINETAQEVEFTFDYQELRNQLVPLVLKNKNSQQNTQQNTLGG